MMAPKTPRFLIERDANGSYECEAYQMIESIHHTTRETSGKIDQVLQAWDHKLDRMVDALVNKESASANQIAETMNTLITDIVNMFRRIIWSLVLAFILAWFVEHFGRETVEQLASIFGGFFK